jgi:uncharacterized cupredoxin-like copper-binding protein
MKHPMWKKQTAAFILAATLPVLGSVALASGTHGGGHGEHKPEAHGHAEGHGHGAMKIDYSDVEEHEFGKASDPMKAARVVMIDMSDGLRFEPSEVTIKKGETVKFVVRNKGKLQHEMVLGTNDSLSQHAKMMLKFPGMEHDEPHMAHVDPGKDAVMGWQFSKAGVFNFGCLVPGHYEGGMKGKITVQ